MSTSTYANQDPQPSKMSTSIYAAPDPTQRVIYAKRTVQTRADTEDGGEHIYESVDIRSYEDVPGPQEDVTEDTTGRQGEFDGVENRLSCDFLVSECEKRCELP